jgi:hypothetical protein
VMRLKSFLYALVKRNDFHVLRRFGEPPTFAKSSSAAPSKLSPPPRSSSSMAAIAYLLGIRASKGNPLRSTIWCNNMVMASVVLMPTRLKTFSALAFRLRSTRALM